MGHCHARLHVHKTDGTDLQAQDSSWAGLEQRAVSIASMVMVAHVPG